MLVEQLRAIDRRHFEPYLVTILPNQKNNLVARIPEDVEHLELSSLFKIWQFLRREKIHAVVTSLFNANLYGRIAAFLAGVSVILSSELNISAEKRWWQVKADQILARFTKKILVSSNEVLEFTAKQESLPREKFQLNFNAIPLRLGGIKERRNEILAKLSLPPELVYIVTAGRLIEQKGHKYLIEAAKKIQGNFKVLIFGKGVLEEELREAAGEKVKLMGLSSMEEILAISDIFVFPSLWEGLSIALLQAMDAGCPIVATKISGTNEVLQDGVDALLIEPGRTDELSFALERLLKDQELRTKLARGAQERVKEFSIEKNVKVIENLIWPRS